MSGRGLVSRAPACSLSPALLKRTKRSKQKKLPPENKLSPPKATNQPKKTLRAEQSFRMVCTWRTCTHEHTYFEVCACSQATSPFDQLRSARKAQGCACVHEYIICIYICVCSHAAAPNQPKLNQTNRNLRSYKCYAYTILPGTPDPPAEGAP